MAFEIEMFEPLEFDIPAGKDKKVTVSVPPFDCFDPKDVDAINKKLREYEHPEVADAVEDVNNPLKNGAALVRFMLKYFNPSKEKSTAIDKLVPRQLNAIDEVWSKNSNMQTDDGELATTGEALGESEPSMSESSPTEK